MEDDPQSEVIENHFKDEEIKSGEEKSDTQDNKVHLFTNERIEHLLSSVNSKSFFSYVCRINVKRRRSEDGVAMDQPIRKQVQVKLSKMN